MAFRLSKCVTEAGGIIESFVVRNDGSLNSSILLENM